MLPFGSNAKTIPLSMVHGKFNTLASLNRKMNIKIKLLVLVTVLAAVVSTAQAQDKKQWTDASGHYTVTAELIAYDEQRVVLQKENDELISIALKDLSKQDQDFIAAKLKQEDENGSPESLRTWKMANGLHVQGVVVDYAERDVAIGRHRAKVYVEDRVLANLPEIYQKMIPRIVSHFEEKEIEDEKALNSYLRRKSKPLQYQLEGVLLELANGDRYGVPFFFFSDADQKALKPGWERWVQAKDDAEAKKKESLYLRAQAQANAENIQRMRQISEVNLHLQAYNAGLFDLWEVAIAPRGGGRPMVVVVPGRDSREATNNALAKYPNAIVGAVAKVRSRRR